MLKGKKVLFISASFFNYEKMIADELNNFGAEVFFEDERPENSFLTKLLIRVAPITMKRRLNEYYSEIIKKYEDVELDYIFFIKAEAIPEKKLTKLFETQQAAKKILYLWDSFHYNPNAKKLYNYFDAAYTFDSEDSRNYTGLRYFPLFYSDFFSVKKQVDNEYDWVFIGTVHTDRYKVLKEMERISREKDLKYFIYCYYPSKMLFFLRLIINPSFGVYCFNRINFNSLKLSEIANLFSKSIAVLDINRPKQRGLTIRSIEALGARCKLITTNKIESDTPSFEKVNYLEIDRNNITLKEDFFQLEGEFNDVEKYSLSAWLERVFTHVK